MAVERGKPDRKPPIAFENALLQARSDFGLAQDLPGIFRLDETMPVERGEAHPMAA